LSNQQNRKQYNFPHLGNPHPLGLCYFIKIMRINYLALLIGYLMKEQKIKQDCKGKEFFRFTVQLCSLFTNVSPDISPNSLIYTNQTGACLDF
jgi:hypothetical protein